MLKVSQSCPTLYDPMNYTVHGILQARILVDSCYLLQGIFPTQGSNPGLPDCRQTLYHLSHQGSPEVTGKFGLGVQNKAGQRVIEFCQENSLVIANTLFQQHKRRLYTWTSPDGQHRNQIDYILCRQRWRSSIQSAKTRPGAECRSDHELLIAKFRLKLKKVGKTTRPFRSYLNGLVVFPTFFNFSLNLAIRSS